jgi:hypothetical protein
VPDNAVALRGGIVTMKSTVTIHACMQHPVHCVVSQNAYLDAHPSFGLLVLIVAVGVLAASAAVWRGRR